jgi:hypothetical protein
MAKPDMGANSALCQHYDEYVLSTLSNIKLRELQNPELGTHSRP